jgi:dinuclear metal center YbgI/SA1388 family protein
MKLKEIYEILNTISPFELQESWDNSGLIVGSMDTEITQIALSLDVDAKLLEELEEGTLLLTHHPLIFGGVKRFDFDTYPANLLHTMVQKNISNIALHTNFDQTHLNEYVATEILGYEVAHKDGFILYMDVESSMEHFLKRVQESFSQEHLRYVACCKEIKRVALTTGSGCSLMRNVEADCFLTGDIKYHDAMEAKSIGLSLIDIGHYESERFFGEILAKHLKNLGLKVIIAQSENPFSII